MAELKTKPTGQSVNAFLRSIPDPQRRRECQALVAMMKRETGSRPAMWGPGMVGFGRYHYRYDSGREGEWFLTGFSPRKGALTVYVMSGFDGHEPIMRRLGRYKTGKSCLYIRKLDDVDIDVLGELISKSVRQVRQTYGG